MKKEDKGLLALFSEEIEDDNLNLLKFDDDSNSIIRLFSEIKNNFKNDIEIKNDGSVIRNEPEIDLGDFV